MKILGGTLFVFGFIWSVIGEYFLLTALWPVAKLGYGYLTEFNNRQIFDARSFRFDYQIPMLKVAWGWSLFVGGLLSEGFGYKLATKKSGRNGNQISSYEVSTHGQIGPEIEETVASIERFLKISRSRRDR